MNKTGKRILSTPKRNRHYSYGAYLLLFYLNTKVLLPLKFSGYLQPGHYGYAGSAWGSGGLRARCARHLQRKKKRHWHIDWLTSHATKITIAAFREEYECNLVQKLLTRKEVTTALKGFGNSDCTTCSSHLLVLPSNFSLNHLKQPSFLISQ